jgi:hypothetical protein
MNVGVGKNTEFSERDETVRLSIKMPENYWNPDRVKLFEQLTSADEGIAELYNAAVDLLGDSQVLNPSVRIMTICHYMREVLNALPETLGESPEIPLRGRIDNTKERDVLLCDCDELFGQQENYAVSETVDLIGDTSLPKQMVEHLKTWARSENTVTTKRRTRDAWLTDKLINPNNPALPALEKSRDFFMKNTHYRVGYAEQTGEIDDRTILEHIEVIETIMRSRLGFFFDIQAELLTLVEDANKVSEVDEGFIAPTDDQIESVRVRLAHPQQRRIFYTRLENPLWVKPLFEAGLFVGPMDGEYWVEIYYLIKMSSIVSSDVLSVFLSIVEKPNQFLRQGIARSAALMDAVDASELANCMAKWADSSSLNQLLDPNDLETITVQLLSNEETIDSGRRLTNAFYTPRKASTVPNIGLPEPSFAIEEYFYAQTLPVIALRLGKARVVILQRWLEQYMDFSNKEDAESKIDMSYVWRSTVLESTEFYTHVVGNALVDELKRALIESLGEGTKKWQHSIDNNWPIIRRVAIAGLVEFFESNDIELLNPEIRRQIIDATKSVLSCGDFYRYSFESEFDALLRTAVKNNLLISLAPCFDVIRNEHPIYGSNGSRKESFHDVEDKRVAYCERWQLHYLTKIGDSFLPTDLFELKEELVCRYGDDQFTMPADASFIQVGTLSPLSLDEMKNLGPNILLNHLIEWEPDNNSISGASYDGQSRALGGLIVECPDFFETNKNRLVELKPIYISTIFSGFEYAMQAGKSICWNTVADLANWVIDEAAKPNENAGADDYFDENSFKQAKSALANLLEAASGNENANCMDKTCLPIVIPCILRLAADLNPDADFEESYGGDNMDPLTLSLHSIRPMAIRTLIRLSSRFPDAPEVPEMLSIIEEHFHDSDDSTSVAAAMGEGYPNLFLSNTDWAESRINKVYGSVQPLGLCEQISLSSSLYAIRPNSMLLEMLRAPIREACIQMKKTPLVFGIREKSLPEQIGDWIVRLYVQDFLSADDELVDIWFDNANLEVREKVMNRISWAIRQEKELPQTMIENFIVLWNNRFAYVSDTPEDAIELNGVFVDCAFWTI